MDRYRNYQPYRPTPPRKNRKRGLFLLFCVVAALFVGNAAWKKITHHNKDNVAVASTKAKEEKQVTAEPIDSDSWNQLSQSVSAIINDHPELDISVALIDVNSNTKANYGIQNNFAGASTTKVLTGVTFLHQVEQGEASLNDSINGMSAKQQLKQMINQSNNESWSALNDTVGGANLENYAHSIGMSSYKYRGNLMTASDEALLLEKLYKGELINDTNKQLLLSYMQDTNNEDMIPVVIPANATLYHKYGQLEDRLHDAAIVDFKGRPIVLVIYTKGEADAVGTEYQNRVQLIKQIAQTAFNIVYAS